MGRRLKVVVVGESGSDQIKLLFTYTTNEYPTEYVPTVFDNYSANVILDGSSLQLGLWSTAYQEDYNKLRPLSYPGTDAFVLIFNIHDRGTYDRVKINSFEEISHHCPGTPFILVGIDDCINQEERDIKRGELEAMNLSPVSPEEMILLADEIGAFSVHYTHLPTFSGVKEVFDAAMRAALAHDAAHTRRPSITEGLAGILRKPPTPAIPVRPLSNYSKHDILGKIEDIYEEEITIIEPSGCCIVS